MGASLFWGAVSAASLLISAVLGVARRWDPKALGRVLGFVAGALLVMLVVAMIPEAHRHAGRWAGLAAVLGSRWRPGWLSRPHRFSVLPSGLV